MATGVGAHGDKDRLLELSQGTQIELSVCGKKLLDMDVFSKSDPFCVLYMKDPSTKKWREKDRTETIWDNLNPAFAKKFEVDYSFGETVDLKFELYDQDKDTKDLSKQDFLGMAEFKLDEIASSGKGIWRPLIGPKPDCGQIKVIGQELDKCKDLVQLEMLATKVDKMDVFGSSDPFLSIHRQNENGEYVVVHRTEMIKNNLNPKWKPFKIPLNKLCNGDIHRQLKIECWDWNRNGSHSYIGECETTLHRLRSGPGSNNTYDCMNEKKLKKLGHGKYKHSGQIKLVSIKTIRKPTFVEYLLGRTELHCTFAVDFGKTNKDLHKLKPDTPNLYQQALKGVGEVMQSYDKHNSFPALGFGAKIDNKIKHSFNMNGHDRNPNCKSLDGVLQAYERAADKDKVEPSGPTNMAPSIEYVAKLARDATAGEHYHVLVILTSGTVHDMAQTRSTIVDAATLPLSIIIVGIGNHDHWEDMVTLDGDDERLMAGSKRAERDIVQFVPFRDYVQKGENSDISQKRLARAVLEEVPDQLLSYMESKRIQPRTAMDTNL